MNVLRVPMRMQKWFLVVCLVSCFTLSTCFKWNGPSHGIVTKLYATTSSEKTTSVDAVDQFCQFTNNFMRSLVIKPVLDYAELIPSRSGMSFLEKITSPPQTPGLPRPVTLTIAASVPTALVWYGWYKFSVEEELYQDELKRTGKVSGCGGYGTLLPFVFLFLIGLSTSWIPVVNEISGPCIEAGSIWILLGQVNLYRRVNELCKEEFQEEPLHSWWALLPPPLDVVVGLRQVHFLAKYWSSVRKEDFPKDIFADTWFPFISSERFTLRQFVQEPRRWFWFTKDAKDFDFEFLDNKK